MSLGSIDLLECMTQAELIGLVRSLIAEVGRMRTESERLSEALTEQRSENERLSEALAGLRVENQTLKDEIKRLKGLPPRPPHKPTGLCPAPVTCLACCPPTGANREV